MSALYLFSRIGEEKRIACISFAEKALSTRAAVQKRIYDSNLLFRVVKSKVHHSNSYDCDVSYAADEIHTDI